MRKLFLATLALGLMTLAEPTMATVISHTYAFTASGFVADAPIQTIAGSFTIAFDNSNDILDTTSGLTVNSLNIAVDGAVAYKYEKTGDLLLIGGTEGGAGARFNNVNDLSWRLKTFRRLHLNLASVIVK